MNRSTVLMTWGLSVLLAAPAAQAADALGQCFEGTQGVMVFREANLFADLVDALEKDFGGVPAVDAEVAGWRAAEVGQMRPGARKWGRGLYPDRGVAVCAAKDRLRFVLGAESVEAVRSAVKGIAGLVGESVSYQGSAGFTFDGESFKCAARAGFVVCDSQDPSGQGAPVWGDAVPVSTSGMFFAAAQTPKMPFKGIFTAITRDAKGVKLTVRTKLLPQMAPMVAQVLGDSGPGRLGRYVDRSAAFVAKSSVDGSSVIGMAMRGAPAAAQSMLKAVQSAWTGEVILTNDGALTHPVLLVGVRDAASAMKMVNALVSALQSDAGFPISVVNLASREGLKAVRIQAEELTIDIPFALVDGALVFAAAPEDVERRTKGRVDPMPMGQLDSRGVQGFVFSNPGALLDMPWIREILDIPLVGPSPIVSVMGAFMDRIELRVALDGDTVKVDGRVRTLSKDAPGRAEFVQAIRLNLQGDAVGSDAKLIQVAAKHAGTPVGWQARARLTSSAALIPMVGVLAAIAIPSFIKYTRRSKTSEATRGLRMLFDAAVAYRYAEHVDKNGKTRPPMFPESAPLTPARSACASGGKIPVDPDAWSHPTWRALGFSMDRPHLYQYEFVSDGKSFTARAIGDLDCDGVMSTFERTGTVDRDGTVSGGLGVLRRDPLE